MKGSTLVSTQQKAAQVGSLPPNGDHCQIGQPRCSRLLGTGRDDDVYRSMADAFVTLKSLNRSYSALPQIPATASP